VAANASARRGAARANRPGDPRQARIRTQYPAVRLAERWRQPEIEAGVDPI